MATWNVDKPNISNQISADIPDITENLNELHDVIEAITNGTLGTTEASAFKVDALADGTTGFASATCQPFYQNSAPTGWTRKTDLTDTSMFCYAASGNVAAGGSVNPQATHTHTGPSHTHTGPSHSHAGGTLQVVVNIPQGGWSTSSGQGAYRASASIPDYYGIIAARDLTSGYASGNTGAGGTGATGAGGTGNTGANTAPYYIEMILATVD